MSSFKTLSIFVAVLFVTSVVSQQQIVSVDEIEDGGTFSINCDASRVTDLPSSVNNIVSLGIRLRTSQTLPNAATTNGLLAQYKSYGSVTQIQNIPPGRSWTVSFTGVNGGTNNRNSMKLVVLVSDAKCIDAGLYTCDVQYEDSIGATQEKSSTKNMTAKASAQDITLNSNIYNAVPGRPNYSEHQEGDNITLTCRIDGPQELEMMWKTGTYDTFSGFITSDYPFDNDITTSDPTLISSGACNTYGHMSVLNLRSLSQDVNDQVMYLCVIMESDQFGAAEVARANLTIGITSRITTPNPGPATAGGGGDEDLGMILGIVFGLLALIVIIVLIVYFCWWRRRGKGDKYGDKEMDEPQTDPNFNAPPPVFYSKPSKHKDEKDNAIPAGMTNDAMDTSYDSRDSANRGPPRYANTDPAPQFEKENHRGRSNRGYSEEDADRNGGRGRRPPRERDSHDQNGRHNRSRDYDEEEPRRRYSTDDGTDDRHYSVQGIGDASIGTAI